MVSELPPGPPITFQDLHNGAGGRVLRGRASNFRKMANIERAPTKPSTADLDHHRLRGPPRLPPRRLLLRFNAAALERIRSNLGLVEGDDGDDKGDDEGDDGPGDVESLVANRNPYGEGDALVVHVVREGSLAEIGRVDGDGRAGVGGRRTRRRLFLGAIGVAAMIGVLIALGGGDEGARATYAAGLREEQERLLDIAERLVRACSKRRLSEDKSECRGLCGSDVMCCFEEGQHSCRDDEGKSCAAYTGYEVLVASSPVAGDNATAAGPAGDDDGLAAGEEGGPAPPGDGNGLPTSEGENAWGARRRPQPSARWRRTRRREPR